MVAYFIGNLVMKIATTPLSTAACGLLAPVTPYGLIPAVLFVAGATRSMQFPALATLALAGTDAERRSSTVRT